MGRKRATLEQLRARATFRPDRHADLLPRLVPPGSLEPEPEDDPPPAPPAGLSAPARAFWEAMTRRYRFEPHELELLRLCAEALDDGRQARRQKGKRSVVTMHGELRPHPSVRIEREARGTFQRLLKQLGLPEA